MKCMLPRHRILPASEAEQDGSGAAQRSGSSPLNPLLWADCPKRVTKSPKWPGGMARTGGADWTESEGALNRNMQFPMTSRMNHLARRLWPLIQARTARLTCQEAL